MERVGDTSTGGCWQCPLLVLCALFPSVPLGRTNPTQKPNGSGGSKCYLSLLCCRTLMGNLGTIKLLVTENLGLQRTPLAELLSRRCLPCWAAAFRAGQQALPLTLRTPESLCSPIALWAISVCSVLCMRGWRLVYCPSVVSVSKWFIAASLPRGTLIKFKATWCDFNLNVFNVFSFYIAMMCVAKRNATGSDLASLLFVSAAPWFCLMRVPE